jgi:hypothetical protein
MLSGQAVTCSCLILVEDPETYYEKMKAISTFAALLLAMILLAVMPRSAAAELSFLLSDGVGAETTSCAVYAEFQQSGEACGHVNCTESCPSDCLFGTGECCVSGLLLNLFQKSLAIAALLFVTEAMADFRNGIEPERLPEPP